MNMVVFNIAALVALIPMALLGFLCKPGADTDVRDLGFWTVVLVGIAGTYAWVWSIFGLGWQTGLAPTLWVTIAGALSFFAMISMASATCARLLPLFGSYLICLGVLATIWGLTGHELSRGLSPATPAVPAAWLNLHIGISVATYALVTLAATAAFAVYMQERALKARKPTFLTAVLPSAADGERLQRRLLWISAMVLGLGLVTGMVTEYMENGVVLVFNHKILFSVLAFAVIVGLLLVSRIMGLAGQRAARYLLLAYLFLTLGYPGVKLVSDIILG
ncbi:MAG: cytochrome c biogenesis protein CcsA [Rhodospirillales bacterium]|jgi:ABC-type uncharacterized transport system permease subunit|nr:cytochrome c biogenesis protein CcsA [Rhodospirillales bacterium]MBT4006027.1 cytochrome c biogenesis protein CcsA [Rhodospirillales bacterium]MBT5076707.1 cytochrome c biogenesis protein CcsA [Rhodospirillales bacterium]MBT5112770.1 cytochrome c biogenesis protein CcsA [Rhodospirillales bacterium]MBT5673540.1 cytochrome c biogenesis protein CcsA [Rhodospirillales bacterium]